MRHRSFRYSDAADADIVNILEETERQFGVRQQAIYATLIDRAAHMVAEGPDRGGSRARPELGPSIRSFRVALAATRRDAAAHTLYYLASPPQGKERVLILRVLHERMDPALHIAGGEV